jgi:hypothetical protein
MGSCGRCTGAAGLEWIIVSSWFLVGIVEQGPAPNLPDHVEKALFNDVRVNRHNARLSRFDWPCVGRELHRVKVAAWFYVAPT